MYPSDLDETNSHHTSSHTFQLLIWHIALKFSPWHPHLGSYLVFVSGHQLYDGGHTYTILDAATKIRFMQSTLIAMMAGSEEALPDGRDVVDSRWKSNGALFNGALMRRYTVRLVAKPKRFFRISSG